MKYVHKPIEVEAMQFDGTYESAIEIIMWEPSKNFKFRQSNGILISSDAPYGKEIGTVNRGDWIVRQADGTINCLFPGVFCDNYQPAIS
jgi:hypothetical protein